MSDIIQTILELQKQVSELSRYGNSGVPTGAILEYNTSNSPTPPAGFLVCDGTAISRDDYAKLFSVISTNYGVGDGSTTFNLPDQANSIIKI